MFRKSSCQHLRYFALNSFLSFILTNHVTSPKETQVLKYDVYEEIPPETTVGKLVEDSGLSMIYNKNILGRLRFEFLHGDSMAVKYFEVDKKSGVLMTSKLRLDRDHPDLCRRKESCLLSLDVVVQPPEFFQIIKVRAELLDLNDNPPSFLENEIFLSINEASPVGSSYVLPSASDDDSPRFGIQRYEIESPSEKFSMTFTNSASGMLEAKLELKLLLDRELEPRYKLTLKAIDGGKSELEGFSSLTGTMTINVIVSDFNDNKPVFEQSSYEISLREDYPVGSMIIRLSASDADEKNNGEIEYLFAMDTAKSYSKLFRLRNSTGELFLIDPLDREQAAVHQLRIVARDRGMESLSSETEVVIRVDDVNDNQPIISVTFLDDGGTGGFPKHPNAPQQSKFVSTKISEDAVPGSFVGHVSVRDADEGDGGKVECSKNGSIKFLLQNSSFSGEYRIVLNSYLDRESSPFYFITLLCYDRGEIRKSSEMLIKIVVRDVNDNAPEFDQATYRASLAENNFIGEVVLQVSAKDLDDGDNSKIDYSLQGGVDRYFQVDQRGLISALVRIDREITESFEFYVTATDRGTPKRSSSAQVSITIDDLNDEKPVFTKSSYTFSIFENEPIGTAIGRIEARDRDLNPFNEFTYQILSSHNSATSRLFHVHPNSGVISTKTVFDRETQSFYRFYVSAVDSHVEPMFGTAVVICSILDQNDNFPEIRFPTSTNDTLYISNRLPAGSVVGRIDAVDNDTDSNGKISYRFIGHESNLFQIDKTSGVIKIARDLTKHDLQIIKLDVEVSDHGNPPNARFSELKIHINSSAGLGSSQKSGKSEFLSSISGAYTLVLVIAVSSIVFIFVIALLVCAVLLRQHRQKRKSKHKSGLSIISCDEAYELAQSTPNKDGVLPSSPPSKTCLSPAGDQPNLDVHVTTFNGVATRGPGSTKFGKKYQPLTALHESSNKTDMCANNGGLSEFQRIFRPKMQLKIKEEADTTRRFSPATAKYSNSPLPPPPPPRALHRFLAHRIDNRSQPSSAATSSSDDACGSDSFKSPMFIKRAGTAAADDQSQENSDVDRQSRQHLVCSFPACSSSETTLDSSSGMGGVQTTEKKVAFNLDNSQHSIAEIPKLESIVLTARTSADELLGGDCSKIKEVSV